MRGQTRSISRRCYGYFDNVHKIGAYPHILGLHFGKIGLTSFLKHGDPILTVKAHNTDLSKKRLKSSTNKQVFGVSPTRCDYEVL